jgi:hypothetical protein
MTSLSPQRHSAACPRTSGLGRGPVAARVICARIGDGDHGWCDVPSRTRVGVEVGVGPGARDRDRADSFLSFRYLVDVERQVKPEAGGTVPARGTLGLRTRLTPDAHPKGQNAKARERARYRAPRGFRLLAAAR